MSIIKIIHRNGKVNAFDLKTNCAFSVKSKLLQRNLCVRVANCVLFLTSDSDEIMETFRQYFDGESIADFNGPMIFLRVFGTERAESGKDNLFIVDKRNDVYKCVSGDSYVFKTTGACIRINKGWQYGEAFIDRAENWKDSLPILIKVIEAMIISTHLEIGWIPVHASVIETTEGVSMILADSQCGKTTTAKQLTEGGKGNVLSDDVAFLNGAGKILPFGCYVKEMSDEVDGAYAEILKDGDYACTRRIQKLNIDYSARDVHNIIFPRIHVGERRMIRIEEENAKLNLIFKQICTYPNEWFLFSDANLLAIDQVMTGLVKKDAYVYEMPYLKGEVQDEHCVKST